MNPKCPFCPHSLIRNGYTPLGHQRWLCRKDRGGCGYSCTDSSNPHGGARRQTLYTSNAERQRAYRARKKAKKTAGNT